MSKPSRLGGFASSIQETSSTSVAGGYSHADGMRWKPSIFDYKSGSGKTCPTCQGTGRIPKGQEDELVALIPYKDKRLKPRRTCLYVCVVAVLILLCGGVLTGFMYPRNVNVTIVSVNSTNRMFIIVPSLNVSDNNTTPVLQITTIVKVKNPNFFPVTITTLNVTLTYQETQVGLSAWSSFSIASQSDQTVSIAQNATFIERELMRKVVYLCTSFDQPFLYMKTSVLLGYVYLSKSSDTIASSSEHVNCRFLEFLPAIATLSPLQLL